MPIEEAGQNFRGQWLRIGYKLRMGYKTLLQVQAERANFFACTPLMTLWGTLVANEINKNLSNGPKFVGERRQFGDR